VDVRLRWGERGSVLEPSRAAVTLAFEIRIEASGFPGDTSPVCQGASVVTCVQTMQGVL